MSLLLAEGYKILTDYWDIKCQSKVSPSCYNIISNISTQIPGAVQLDTLWLTLHFEV